MDKITAAHLERTAYVYVRQSTAVQLVKNPESRRRQYALEPRARSLGWQDVVVIDDDLGRSGGASCVRDLTGYSQPSAAVPLGPCWRSRFRGWPGMAGTGTHVSSFALWLEASSSMRRRV